MNLTSRSFLATVGATALLGGTAFAGGAIKGTDGDDTLTGTATKDRILARAGNDVVNGLGGRDVLHGGSGDDVQNGGDGRDRIWAHAGRDTSNGENGNDRLWAVAVADVLSLGDEEGDTLNGGAGNDRIHVRDGERDVVDCGDGARDRAFTDQFDTTANCERVRSREVTQAQLDDRRARAARRAER
jgi:Ca2+-binding RTX toxin-like protein